MLMLGLPSSMTRTTIIFVLGPCASVGDQVNKPLTGSMLAPAGAPGSRLKLRFCVGKSESDALMVKLTVVSSGIVRFAIGGTFGALFTLLTVTVKLLLSLKVGEPLSDTRIVKL